MGKCIMCGRKGLFFKVDSGGMCVNCREESEHKDRLCLIESAIADKQNQMRDLEGKLSDRNKLLTEAMVWARTEAQKALAEQETVMRETCEKLRVEIFEATGRRDALVLENETAQKNLSTAQKNAEKLRSIVKSCKMSQDLWMSGESFERAYSDLSNADIELLLSQPDLNCLTVKQLKSKYTALRKQIAEVCTAYESRYTTKANATIYRLMVLALEAELENVLHNLQFGKLETGVAAVRELTSKYYAIASEGNQSIAPTLKRFVGQIESLYLEVVETEYEYYVQRERAKEEQRALREQMRQEAEERKRLEQERKHVEAEEKKYQLEIERITVQMQQAHDSELEALRKRLDEMSALMNKVVDKKAEIINLQNGKAGTVYIISNIGSFGDHVFKIGMTRRLEPQDRVNELGDASVPFPFDVHSFIFSEDAVALESALHRELNDRRVNKVNLRKEFFDVTIDELQALVERIDPTAPFRVTALAEQYRQSMSITEVPVNASISCDGIE